MIDQKYYMITLMAIFLSLSTGIFIGNALLGNDMVITQQREVIERLQQNYYELEGEHHCLQERLYDLEVWEGIERDLERVLLCLIKDRKVFGVRAAIVNTCGDDLDRGLLEYLQECGILVGPIGTITASFNPHNKKLPLVLKEGYIPLAKDAKEEWRGLVKYLAHALTSPGEDDFLSLLMSQGLVTISGDQLPEVDVVLLIGDSRAENLQRIEGLDYPLLDAWKKEGLRVIAAERADPRASPKLYRKKGISTIAHLNTIAGRLSLLYLLHNDVQGHFGFYNDGIPSLPLEWLLEQVLEG